MTPRLLFFLFFIFFNFIYSQKEDHLHIYRAVDSKGEGIPFTSIFSEYDKNNLITTSNQNGKFILSKKDIKEGGITISHSNFEKLIISFDDLKSNTNITLNRKTYNFNPIIVYGNKYNFESDDLPQKHEKINSIDYPTYGNSLGGKLDRFGLNIKDYGGGSGLKTISSPTGFSEHVLVMVDGFEINSPQNGVVDLSAIPADFFSHAEYYYGQGSSIHGSNAVGGTINLIPSLKNSYLKMKTGSMGEQGVSLNSNINSENSNFLLFINNYKNENDYRKNNAFKQASSGLSFKINNLYKWDLSTNLIYMNSDRRIPGSLSYPSLSAFKTNEDVLLTFKASTVSKFGYSSISGGNYSTNENYVDPDWMTNSNHNIQTNRLKFGHRSKFLKKTINIFSLDLAKMKIKSDDTGNHNMNTIGTSYLLNYNFSQIFKISPSLRIDWNDHSNNTSSTANFAFIISPKLLIEKFIFNGGTSFRNPTFNDLFWLDSGFSKGNPNLKPETGSSYEAEITLRPLFNNQFNLSINGSFFRTINLIQWSPDENFVYSPQNILDSESSNFGITTKIDLNDFPFELISGFNQINSEVLSDGDNKGMRLLYLPTNSFWSELKLKLKSFSSIISYRNLQGRRYSYYEDNLILKNYERLDFSISINFNLFSRQINLDGGARNLLNKKNIQSVYDYSEPGRSYFLSVLFNL